MLKYRFVLFLVEKLGMLCFHPHEEQKIFGNLEIFIGVENLFPLKAPSYNYLNKYVSQNAVFIVFGIAKHLP